MLKLFYQEHCPYCIKARRYISELAAEEGLAPKIEMIEETEQPQIADQYDYYYVPTFYDDDNKLHEGPVTKDDVRQILKKG
jgi:thiol-disulfide isomerase/thioredoxin